MLIIFDLDGVLVDARPLHFHAFNTAVAAFGNQYVLSWDEHQAYFDGLPTRRKLELLTERKGFPVERHERAWETKQAISTLMVEQVFPDPRMQTLLEALRADGHTLACVSNSVQATVDRMLIRTNLLDQFDLIVGNDRWPECKPKPAPDCFRRVMKDLGFDGEHTLIIEDSEPGLRAASGADGAAVFAVSGPEDVTYSNIAPRTWELLIPMAGAGSRFAAAGYTFPKPLIEVDGKPMIQTVVENLDLPAHHIFIIQAEHERRYNVSATLHQIAPGCDHIVLDTLTDGAACTALKAEGLIDDRPLLIANSDQWIDWDREAFIAETQRWDGLIPVFDSVHPKWSYARAAENGRVTAIAEKRAISRHATCGLYWWRHGHDFVEAAKRMIDADDRTNDEFYIAPTYNHATLTKGVGIFEVNEMWGLGTPEDLERFLAR